jgi:hypothetical protein
VTTFSFLGFVKYLAVMEADLHLAEDAFVVKASKLVQQTAKGFIGNEQPFWPPLADATIAHKAHGNTPLLETGELKHSIQYTAPVHEGSEVCGYVGTNDPVGKYHELGTGRIPPRPFLSSAAMQKSTRFMKWVKRWWLARYHVVATNGWKCCISRRMSRKK